MELPRDLQLKVLSKVNMDTRIKMGIIGKLKVPEALRKSLENIQLPRYDVAGRWTVQMRKKHVFALIFVWDSFAGNKMVTTLRPNLDFTYWISNDDHTIFFQV